MTLVELLITFTATLFSLIFLVYPLITDSSVHIPQDLLKKSTDDKSDFRDKGVFSLELEDLEDKLKIGELSKEHFDQQKELLLLDIKKRIQ